MPNRFKHKINTELARIGKALSSPHRLELLELLGQGERSVEELARETAIPVANASHHLQVLHRARLVDSRRRGVQILYRLADCDVTELRRILGRIAERHIAEVERLVRTYLSASGPMKVVSREELLRRARTGEVIVLDVRPAREFRAGHIPGAVSVPLAELQNRLSELPSCKEIVAYCRGPYCIMAVEAVVLLNAQGRVARRLVDGFPEWQAAGYPVESAGSA